MAEMLDIYDQNLVKIGVKERKAVHRDGDWHRTFHCWVIYRDAQGIDYVVMQKRGPDKELCPNMVDVAVGGHYAAGETIADGIREIREELGLEVRFESLIPVGVRVSVARYDTLVDQEFNDVFLLIDDRPLKAYEYQREEISGLVCFRIDDALMLFAGERETISADAVGFDQAEVQLKVDDFILHQDAYVYRALILAKRCLNGEKHLVI